MPPDRRARDLQLLDRIGEQPRRAFNGSAWRVVREGRAPILGVPARGRWDPGQFDVLYTSLEHDGAIVEIHFHLSSQPVFPSVPRYFVYELAVELNEVLELDTLDAIEKIGVSISGFSSLDYKACQAVGDAAYFMGFQGLLVPSARGLFQNLVLFTDRITASACEVVGEQEIDWVKWRATRPIRLRDI
jgi:RES domain-containing protein